MGKNKNKLPDIWKKEDAIRLFENMFIPKLAIACFVAIFCGLRVSEVCKILVADVDLIKREIKIRDSKDPNRAKHGNYGKDRIVPIPECAIEPIKVWLEIIQGGKWFLPSENNPNNHLRPKTVHEWFKDARKRAGLDGIEQVIFYKKPTKFRKASPIYYYRFHGLRHFFANYIYEKTGDIYLVNQLLGHERLETTMIYAKVSAKRKREGVDFAFNNPIRTQIFEKNPMKAINYSIPEVAKRDKSPLEILDERLAKGELSDIEYANKIRLLNLRRDIITEEKEKIEPRKIEREFSDKIKNKDL